MAARSDNVSDPALAALLLVARRGQAYYSRKLNELTDEDLDAPSLLPGWDRRHIVAHVGLNARALTNLTEWAASGIERPMYASPSQRDEDIELAATLPAQALRNLSDHAAIHLNVEWRDLTEEAWTHEVRTAQGRVVPVSETVWMRAREVWIHAVDLDNGGTFLDFPPEFIDTLLNDIAGAWSRRRDQENLPRFVFDPTDRDTGVRAGEPAANSIVVRGRAARIAQWAAGRGAVGLTADGGAVPQPPRWL